MSVAIVGVGIHPFGRHEGRSGLDQGVRAVRQALDDAGVRWGDIQFVYGGSHAAGNADTMVSQLGLTGVPFSNISNGCATGGSALVAARQAILAGDHDLGLVVGFDKHPRGAFQNDPADWGLGAWYGESGLMVTTQFFAMKIQRYMHDYGISADTLARVAAKAFRNGEKNPNAWRRQPLSVEAIRQARMINYPLTQFMLCSPGEGAVALVVARADYARRYCDRPIYVRALTLRTRQYGSFEVFSPSLAPQRAPGPTEEAATAAYEMAGIGPEDIDLAQVQDTESGAEVMHMAETQLCQHGEQESLVAAGETSITGRLPVNTDGGCLANGEPIGASGLRQIHECVLQLQGRAGDRQVPHGPRTAFTHVYGAPGVSACSVLSK